MTVLNCTSMEVFSYLHTIGTLPNGNYWKYKKERCAESSGSNEVERSRSKRSPA